MVDDNIFIHLLTMNVDEGSKERAFAVDSLMNLRTSLLENK